MNPGILTTLARRKRKSIQYTQSTRSIYKQSMEGTTHPVCPNMFTDAMGGDVPINYQSPPVPPTSTQKPTLCAFIYNILLRIYLFLCYFIKFTPILKPLDEQGDETSETSEGDETSDGSTDTEVFVGIDYESSEQDLSDSEDPDYDPENDSDHDPDYDSEAYTDDSDHDPDYESYFSDDDESYRRCLGTTVKGNRCRINTNMAHDESRPSYIQDPAIRMTLDGSHFCTYHIEQDEQLESIARRPSVHPIIYGMPINYRSSVSQFERTAEVEEAYNENGIPTDPNEAWKYLESIALQEQNNVTMYY